MSNDTASLNAEVDRLRLELQTLQAKSGVKGIPVGNYLLTRLAQLGVQVLVISLDAEMYNNEYLFSLCSGYQEISI